MGSKWREVKIGEVVNLSQGQCMNAKAAHLLSEEGLPLLRITDLINDTQRQFINPKLVNKKVVASPSDLIFTRTGQVGLIFRGKSGVVHNNCFKIIPDEKLINKGFVYYFFKQPLVYQQINAFAKGAAQADLNHSAFKSLNFKYPESIETQQKIATILSNYDNLIENNEKRIKILENILKLIYEEWFVRFKFPGHKKNKPDWKKKFSEFVDFKEGPGLRNWQYRETGFPFLNIRTLINNDIDFNKIQYIDTKEANERYTHFFLKENDHVISSSGTIGRLVTIQTCHLPIMLNTSIIRMRPRQKNIGTWQLKHFLLSSYFQDQIKAYAIGAAQMNYGPSHLEKMWIIAPSEKIGIEYEKTVNPLEESIKKVARKNQALRKTRDLLLPRLISGEIDVSDLNIQLNQEVVNT